MGINPVKRKRSQSSHIIPGKLHSVCYTAFAYDSLTKKKKKTCSYLLKSQRICSNQSGQEIRRNIKVPVRLSHLKSSLDLFTLPFTPKSIFQGHHRTSATLKCYRPQRASASLCTLAGDPPREMDTWTAAQPLLLCQTKADTSKRRGKRLYLPYITRCQRGAAIDVMLYVNSKDHDEMELRCQEEYSH